jgi:hypothetical protein
MMFDVRRKIFQELANSAVTVYTADRIFAGNSVFTPPHEKPFVVIRMGIQNPTGPVYATGAMDVVFALWVHDDPGDYHRIDLVISECRKALLSASREPGFYEFRYLETGADLADDFMSTILKVCRFKAVTREELPTPQP